MNIGSAFKSNYLKHSDLGGKRVMVTIDRVEVETVGQGRDAEEKPVLYFVGHERGLVLNKTNGYSVADITGTEETDEWGGHKIVLYQDRTTFQGKPVPCIRVTAPPASAKAAAPPPPPIAEDFQISDEDVPF